MYATTKITITTTMFHINWDIYYLGAVNDNKMKGKHIVICFLICLQQNRKATEGHKIGQQDTCVRINEFNSNICVLE